MPIRMDALNASLREVTEAPLNFSALLAPNDQYAVELLKLYKERGIAIPERLSLIGFDDQSVLRTYNLTTLQLPGLDLGHAAYELLKALFSEPETKGRLRDIRIKCPVITRSTARKIKQNQESR